jgi:DNA-binding SARP family transcriptional activator
LQNAQGVQPLERKQAALLAFLALEGTQPRSKLAGLLWASSTESTARNNLAQTLKRIREQHGELIQGNGELRL